jgi:hypothetical protein
MAFTDAERTDVRRYCGYPAYATGAIGLHGWRFRQYYGDLEYRLSHLSLAEQAVVRRYLGALASLETGIPNAAANLDTDQAAVWSRNPNEVRDRTRLFDDWRRRLCAFLGVPPGPALRGTGLTLVV